MITAAVLGPCRKQVHLSCSPNAEHAYSPDVGAKRLVTTRNIAAGEQICISYMAQWRCLQPCSSCVCACNTALSVAATHAAPHSCCRSLMSCPSSCISCDVILQLAQSPGTSHQAIAKCKSVLRILDKHDFAVGRCVMACHDVFPDRYSQASQLQGSCWLCGASCRGSERHAWRRQPESSLTCEACC